nr:hypothetical protein F49H6.9 - Caenorhabditis elegans [Caenorhabditis elegans]
MFSSSGVSLILSLVLSYLTLPFYVYVHILRREREKNLPVVQLFYKIVKLSYFVLIIVISMMASIAWIREILEPELSLTEILMDILMISLFIIIYPLHILQQTFHLLLFLLSLFIFVNIAVCLIIPLIYIPIMIDMRKNSHLYSQQHMYLLKYLFNQSFLVALIKLITLPFCLSLFHLNSPLSFVFSMTIGDAVTTPLIIQLSYLKCNSNELFSLYSTFNFWKFLKVLSGKVDNSVNPNLPPNVFSVT